MEWWRLQIPSSLATGNVKTRHIVFLYAVFFGAASAYAVIATRAIPWPARGIYQNWIGHAGSSLLLALVVLAVPELRRALPSLYAPPNRPVTLGDGALVVLTFFTWTLGLYMVMFALPALQWDPDLYTKLGFRREFISVDFLLGFIAFLAACILAPFAEELVYRGLLYNLLARRIGFWPAVILSSIMFGAVHLYGAVYATLGGLCLCLIYVRFNSLWPGTIMHAAYNLLVFPFGPVQFLFIKDPTQIGELTSWLPQFLLALLFVPLAILFWRRFAPPR
jgi:membrane protease YdiL (CAAX protease family)